jgi:hypothetical protein
MTRFTGLSSSIACYSDCFLSNAMHSILGSSSPVLRKTTLRLTDDRFLSSAGRRQPAACRLWSSHKLLLAAFLAFPLLPGLYSQTRLKDLITLEGMRDNQLVGYGLVVGLAGTGDKQTTVFSTQSLANMLQQMGVTVNPTVITVKNTAAVMVTATLPAFAQPGTHIDVTASAIGDAANLQ